MDFLEAEVSDASEVRTRDCQSPIRVSLSPEGALCKSCDRPTPRHFEQQVRIEGPRQGMQRKSNLVF